ncbi:MULTISPECIES: alpha/beta hydrolase [unclassified Streptomyces]|uniref:alpha/beta hydrolase n=1 Tax=unclassified Streptomyces TaxID=2593676 RepID=UPI003D712475
MNRRAAALCAAAAVVTGTLTAVPATAGPSPATQTARAAERTWKEPAPTGEGSGLIGEDSAPTGEDAKTTGEEPGLTWKKCATAAYPTLQCASLKVPLDHADPRGEQITLALSRVPHTAPEYQGPLLVNPGGPGGSGLSLAGFVAAALPEAVAARYDVIGFDPRGVGRSTPALNCRPGHFTPVRPDSVPGTAAVEEANLARARSFAEACARKYPDILPHINTRASAHDMDAIRAALGARRLNYFGYSYGTYLGAVYAKLYPQRVRRMVLDSVVDPTGVWHEDNLTQDRAFDDRHRALMAWIARYDGTYRLGSDPAEVEDEWYAMRAELARKPAGGRVGAAELEDTFLPGGYYDGYWPHLAEAFAAYVNDGDDEPLVEAYENFGAVDASGDNGYSVYTAVECRDATWPADWSRWRSDNWAVYRKAPFLTWNNAWYNAPCAFWPTGALSPLNVLNDALPPVLLFQATEDAATPYEGGAMMHALLSGSSLVVERGGGNHGITLSGNDCLDEHLARYLTDGTVPRGPGEVDAECTAQPDPKPLASKVATGTARGSVLHGLLGFRG